ncbi:MAG: endonuclease I [Bacteroidetes bacterium]|nr:MAG: endonuclease I [Bacteroidota bacterium]
MKIRSILAILIWILVLTDTSAQIPNGYYNSAAGLSGSQLKTALHRIIRNHQVISYTGLWTAFYTTDDKSSGKVWDVYSDIPDGTPPYEFDFGTNQCSTTPGLEGICYNREHTFPQSYFGSSSSDTIYSDLFHLYPCDSYVNTRRSNYPFGEVNSPTWTSQNGSKLGPCVTTGYGGTVFEPLDGFKGDLARNYFYLATRYEHEMTGWAPLNSYGDIIMNGTPYPCYETWFLDMLLQWHAADPVSQKEIDRNNAVYSLQGNRNPFIDHPEYVAIVWAGSSPVVFPEPTNYPASFSAHNIHLQWVDASGAILPQGYLVRMSSTGFAAIPDPVDGTEYPDSSTDKNVVYGVQNAWITNLNANTTYYFKLFSYNGSGAARVYKTDGSVPQLMQATTP